MDGGAWWAAIHGVAKSQTWLSDFTFTFHFHALEKEMATHSSVFAWRIPGTGEPGRLLSVGSHRVRHNWSDLAAAAAYHQGPGLSLRKKTDLKIGIREDKKDQVTFDWNWASMVAQKVPICLQFRRPGLNPWVGKIPWSREEQPTPRILAWRIPQTEELGGLQSMGSQRVGDNWVTNAFPLFISTSRNSVFRKHITHTKSDAISVGIVRFCLWVDWAFSRKGPVPEGAKTGGSYLKVQFSCSVNSLQPHGLQHARLPCPSPTLRTYSNSCPSHWWCHPTISSSVFPFSSHFQSFPASGYFPVSQFSTSGGQSSGVSALASVLPKNIQDLFPLGLTAWMSLQSKVQESSPTPQFKSINSLALSFLYNPTLTYTHDYWKNHSFD